MLRVFKSNVWLGSRLLLQSLDEQLGSGHIHLRIDRHARIRHTLGVEVGNVLPSTNGVRLSDLN